MTSINQRNQATRGAQGDTYWPRYDGLLQKLQLKIREKYRVPNENCPLFTTRKRKDRNGYLRVTKEKINKLGGDVVLRIRKEMVALIEETNFWKDNKKEILASYNQVEYCDMMDGEFGEDLEKTIFNHASPTQGGSLCHLESLMWYLFHPLFPEHLFFKAVLMRTKPGVSRNQWSKPNIMHADFSEETLNGSEENDNPVVIILPLESTAALAIGNYLGPHGKTKKPVTKKYVNFPLGGFGVVDARQHHATAVEHWIDESNPRYNEKTTTCLRVHITLAKSRGHITESQPAVILKHYKEDIAKDKETANIFKFMGVLTSEALKRQKP